MESKSIAVILGVFGWIFLLFFRWWIWIYIQNKKMEEIEKEREGYMAKRGLK